MSFSDVQIREVVETVFERFDEEKSGNLDKSEVKNLLFSSYRHMDAESYPN